MMLNIQEYRWILLNCDLVFGQLKGKQYVFIEPKLKKNKTKLERLMASGIYPTIEEWDKMTQELKPLMLKNAQTLHNAAIKKINETSVENLITLSNEYKLELLEGVLFDVFNNDIATIKQNKEIIDANKEKIDALVFNFDLPPNFILQELKKMSDFCDKLYSIRHLKSNLENWHNLDTQIHKNIATEVLDAFNKTYENEAKLQFVESENSPNEDTYKKSTFLGHVRKDTIYLNTNRMKTCDNMVIPTWIFYEALRITQEKTKWSNTYPIIENLLERKFACTMFDVDNFCIINPLEVHCYNMYNEVLLFLQTEMKIAFIDNIYPHKLKETVSELKNKVFSAFGNKSIENNIK